VCRTSPLERKGLSELRPLRAVAFAAFAISGRTGMDRSRPNAVSPGGKCCPTMATAVFGSSSKQLQSYVLSRLGPSVGQWPLPITNHLSRRSDRSILFDHRVAKHANLLDLNFNHIAGLQEMGRLPCHAYPTRSSC